VTLNFNDLNNIAFRVKSTKPGDLTLFLFLR